MTRLYPGDRVELMFGPYMAVGTVDRVTDHGAVFRMAQTAELVGDSVVHAPSGEQLTLDPNEVWVGKALWPGGTVIGACHECGGTPGECAAAKIKCCPDCSGAKHQIEVGYRLLDKETGDG